jgi:hypothetical protein
MFMQAIIEIHVSREDSNSSKHLPEKDMRTHGFPRATT